MPQFGNSGEILAHDDALKDDWTPEDLPERERELTEIHHALEPASRGYTPNNAFIYGPAGQGKTVATQMKLDQLESYLSDAIDVNTELHTIFVNCADLTSSYQVAGALLEAISPQLSERPRGHGLSNIFDKIFDRMDEIGGIIVIVFDEIDVIGDDDTILYKISRARSNGDVCEARPAVIGISNDFDFYSNLSQRVKDTLCEEEIRFSPYNANQLKAILSRRAEKGFQADVLDDEVIPLCAAYAAQNNGSARQTIRLIYKSGTIAHNANDEQVTETHVEKARTEIERNALREGLKNLTIQEYASLLAVTCLEADEETPALTKEVYSKYKSITAHLNLDTSTMRAVRDHLQALELYSFLDGEKKTGGRNGGERWLFELNLNIDAIVAVLEDNDRFSDVVDTIEITAKNNGIL